MLDWMAPVISAYWRAVLCTGCRYWGWAALHCAACLCLRQHGSFTHWICFNCTRRPRRASSANRHFSRNTGGSVQTGQLSPTPQGTAVPGHTLHVYPSPIRADGIPRAVAPLLFPVCGNRCFCVVSLWQDLFHSFDYANSNSIYEVSLQIICKPVHLLFAFYWSKHAWLKYLCICISDKMNAKQLLLLIFWYVLNATRHQ